MRIAVLNLTRGGISGGYQVYLKSVLPRLANHPDVTALLCLAPPSFQIDRWFPPLRNTAFATCRPFRFISHAPDRSLRVDIQRFAPDVIFIPLGRYLRFKRVPIVNMIQNMGPLVPHVPHNPWSEKVRYLVQQYEVQYTIRRSDYVIAPSQFVQKFLLEKWNISSDRVSVIHYGSNPIVPLTLIKKPSTIPTAWKGRFIFTAGSIEPYRGLEDILGALECLSLERGIDGMVIAGYARNNMSSYQQKLKQWILAHNLSHKVIWTGSLSHEEMSWCYQNSRVFVMTSRIESFAIIGLEAMAHGCICVIADNPPLPEIFSSAAYYYRSSDISDLTVKLQTVLRASQENYSAFQQAAQKRAHEFSWDENVEKLVSVFRKAIIHPRTA